MMCLSSCHAERTKLVFLVSLKVYLNFLTCKVNKKNKKVFFFVKKCLVLTLLINQELPYF